MAKISQHRAERIARSDACQVCREYSYKRVTVKPATAAHRKEFNEVWHVVAVCGICDTEKEMGIGADGEILYVS